MASSDWDCAKCTYMNKQMRRFCEMCGNRRPDATSTDIPKANMDIEKIVSELLNTNETQGWACSSCTFYNDDKRTYCKVCRGARRKEKSESIRKAFKQHDQIAVHGGWTCSHCIFYNDDSRAYCEVCGSAKNDYKSESTRKTFRQLDQVAQIEGASQSIVDGVTSNERRLVLIGKTGTGKSATGNSILGRKEFESLVSGESITKECRRGEAGRFGKEIMVVDTPGLFDTGMTNEMVTREIVKCIGMTSPGPHAFILVVQIGRFTKEEQDTVKHFADSFGEGLYDYLIVLFTRKDDLLRQEISIQEYVKKVPKALKDILQKCNNRYAVIDNVTSSEEKENDVRILMDHIEQMRLDNGKSCYTNEMYQEAEKTLKRRMDQLKKDMEEEKKQQIREIANAITKEYQTILDQETAEKIKYQEKIQMLENENSKKQHVLEEEMKSMQLELKHQNERFKQEKETRRFMDKIEEDRLRRERKEFAEQKKQLDETIKHNKKLAEKEKIKNQRQQEDYERRLKEIEEREKRARKDMETEIAKRTNEIEEEIREKTDSKNIRKQVRDECEGGTGIFSKIWGGIKSAAGAVKRFFVG